MPDPLKRTHSVRVGKNGLVKTRRWVPMAAGAAAFLLTLFVGGIVGTDWLARNIEMDRLVIAIEQSEAAMGVVQDRVGVVFDQLDGDPTLEDAPTDGETAAAVGELAAIAVDGEAAISAAGREIAALNILPWHSDIEAAREAYLLHNFAWQAYMQSAIEDPLAFTVEQKLVNDTFIDAEEPLLNAVPVPELFDLLARVQKIFDEGAPQVDGDVI